jgi:hypothetical protein
MRGKALITAAIAAGALALPATAAAGVDHVSEALGTVSTASTSYVDLGGPTVKVNVDKPGTTARIYLYAQAEQNPVIFGQSALIEVLDNGSPVWGSLWWPYQISSGWGGTGDNNVVIQVGEFSPAVGRHTYTVQYASSQPNGGVSFRYRELDVQLIPPPPIQPFPTSP